MPDIYIGLMSGTSMDGIDAVLASFDANSVTIRATHEKAYPDTLRRALLNAVTTPVDQPIDNVGSIDRQVGECFRDAALELLDKSGISAGDVRAVGSHGQTVRHQPDAVTPYSLQIGNPATIASGTGITTVADFRSADIAAGGQGAPLVPPFHEWLFGGAGNKRVILNIGGISNITILGADEAPVVGFDTGPGNTLLDRWIQRHRKTAFDSNGDWAASGSCIDGLLEQLLSFSYFELGPPKSTGLEDFNLEWLLQHNVEAHDPADVQATLAELTARSVADSIQQFASGADELYVCGGGAHNKDLLLRLARNLPETSIATTAAVGLDPDWVEAVAFAWLGMRTMNNETGNLPSVTGASHKVVLGTIHSP
ncbi:MAG: anhydro-N-acetylmuramic acid kinase [Gammaproteobacteria bacterium]|jgi:anhydro-N-acetylmuramic acid kinase|nr:anhydro-N-acetylmuramic acid kinase [Gammaproteobacteria bacterium]MDH3811797.1 anhydro-N-acetylmuramic acid kinase [Gammaproteobacteria bacterium]